MRHHLSLVLALLVAILLATIAAEELTSRNRFFPKTNETYSSSQWAEIKKRLQSSIADPKSTRIVQPNGSGKVVKNGVINKQIVGGEFAVLGQFPWQVALEVEEQWLCGGSLILRNWILTAAHCVGKKYRVLIGTITRGSVLSSGGVEMISTVSYAHEEYNEYNLRNDIALVKLPEEVTLTDNIKTVALPPASHAPKNFEGTLATVSGFGLTEDNGAPSKDLKFVQLTVISHEACIEYFSTSIVTSGVVCTKQNLKSTCQGDSGGPLVYKDSSDTWTQFGIVSFGSSVSCLEGPSGFTRVTSHLKWMAGKIDGTTTATTTTKKPTTLKTAKPGICALQNFMTLDSKCCKSAPRDLVVFNSTVKSSCKSPNQKAFNSYYLNKHQNRAASNAVVFDEKTKNAIGKDSVFVNCFLKEKGIISADTGLIDDEKMSSFLSRNQEPESDAYDLVWSASFQCFLLLNGSVPIMKAANKKIDGTATIILQCTQLVLNILCADRETSKKCVKDYGNFDHCSKVNFVNSVVFQKVKEMVMQKKALRISS